MHRDFGVKLACVIDTQLLAGLTAMAQAAGGSSDTSSDCSDLRRISVKKLGLQYGYAPRKFSNHKRKGRE
jgi:hypothetical protein